MSSGKTAITAEGHALHSRRRRLGASLVAALALAVTPMVPAIAAPPTTALALTVLGAGAYPMGYETLQHLAADASHVQHGGLEGDVFVIRGTTPGLVAVEFSVSAPGRQPHFVPGHYETRRFADATHAELDLAGCNTSTGWLDVLEVSRDADGRLAGLALDYGTRCDGEQAPPTQGSLRWNSDVPYVHTASTPVARDVAAGVTAHATVTLTNTGDVPQSYGRTTWLPQRGSSVTQPDLIIDRDGCIGATLAPGGSCTLKVHALSDGVRDVWGYLRTPDDTLREASFSRILLRAVAAPSPVTLTATPARGAVRLSATPANPSYQVLRSGNGDVETEIATGVALPWTDTDVENGVDYTYRVVPMAGGARAETSAPATTSPLPIPVGEEGTFVSVDPVRVMDTRDGTGVRPGPLGPGATLRFDPHARGAVPTTGVSAVLLNITGTEPTSVTHVRVWPAGEPRPETSSLNLVPGNSRPNQVVVPVGEDGQIELYNDAGRTHLVVDLQGFYSDVDGPAGGGYHPARPARLLDTRLDGEGRLAPGEEVWIPITAPGVPWTGVAAVDVTLTVTQPTAAGHLTAWAGDGPAPLVSNANFAPAQTVANHAVVPVSVNARWQPGIVVRNSAGNTHLVVDLQGWYDADAKEDGLRFAPTQTTRVADTRTGPGRAPLEPGQTLVVPREALPTAAAHVLNVTATEGVGGGHLTAWSGDDDIPWTSTVNFARGEDSPNLATSASGRGGAIAVTAGTSSTHVVVDHLGIFY